MFVGHGYTEVEITFWPMKGVYLYHSHGESGAVLKILTRFFSELKRCGEPLFVQVSSNVQTGLIPQGLRWGLIEN